MSPHDAIVIMTQNMSRDLDPHWFKEFVAAIGQMSEFAVELANQPGDSPISEIKLIVPKETAPLPGNPTGLDARV